MSGAILKCYGSGGGGGSFTVSVNRNSLFGFGYYPGSSQTNQTVTATPIGGVGPYTYEWVHVSGDLFDMSAPDQATTKFFGYSDYEENFSGQYKCTVTDSTMATADSPEVNISLNFRSGKGF